MTIEINASLRSKLGKGASRKLRNNNAIPAIVYGSGETVKVKLEHNTFSNLLEKNPNFFSESINLNIAGDLQEVLIKEIQRHPYKRKILHVDFQKIDIARKIKKLVPLNFIGEEDSEGAKTGAVFTFFQRSIEISCLAKDLPTAIDVDVSGLEVSESIRLSDLKLPPDIEITALTHNSSDYDQAVVGLSKPKAVEVAPEPQSEEGGEQEKTDEDNKEPEKE